MKALLSAIGIGVCALLYIGCATEPPPEGDPATPSDLPEATDEPPFAPDAVTPVPDDTFAGSLDGAPLMGEEALEPDAPASRTIGRCTFSIGLSQNLFTAIGFITLRTDGCASGSIEDIADRFNDNWFLVNASKSTTAINRKTIVSIFPGVEHKLMAHVCDDQRRCGNWIFDAPHSSKYTHIGKAICKCRDGDVIVKAEVKGAKHCHDCCTRAKKAAANKCTEACRPGGGLIMSLQSTSPCTVKEN